MRSCAPTAAATAKRATSSTSTLSSSLRKWTARTARPNTEAFRLYYTPAANAVNMIKPVLSSEAQVAFTTPAGTGIASGGGDVGGNSHAIEDMLVITDYPENLDRVRKILKEVDRRPQQILVEATLVAASLSEDNALGIDFTVLGGVDFSNLSSVGGGSAAGSGVNQALTGTIIENPNAGKINDNGLIAGKAGGSGLNIGIVKNNVGVFLNALEGITDTTVLANPKLLVLNKQKGEVHVGREDGYKASTVQTETAATEKRDDALNGHPPDLPPLHWRRRLYPHGSPSRRFQRARWIR